MMDFRLTSVVAVDSMGIGRLFNQCKVSMFEILFFTVLGRKKLEHPTKHGQHACYHKKFRTKIFVLIQFKYGATFTVYTF